MLRIPQLKPYIIYIKPPPFDILKETRNESYARSTFDENNSRGFTVSTILPEFHMFPVCAGLLMPCGKQGILEN
jgi:hypothetical protein